MDKMTKNVNYDVFCRLLAGKEFLSGAKFFRAKARLRPLFFGLCGFAGKQCKDSGIDYAKCKWRQ